MFAASTFASGISWLLRGAASMILCAPITRFRPGGGGWSLVCRIFYIMGRPYVQRILKGPYEFRKSQELVEAKNQSACSDAVGGLREICPIYGYAKVVARGGTDVEGLFAADADRLQDHETLAAKGVVRVGYGAFRRVPPRGCSCRQTSRHLTPYLPQCALRFTCPARIPGRSHGVTPFRVLDDSWMT
jgi:hypothetical protein